MRRSLFLLTLITVLGSGVFQSFALSEAPDLRNAEWLLLGPFSYGKTAYAGDTAYERDYLTDLGGEINAKPIPSQKTAGRKWLKVRAVNGQIDLGKVYGDQTDCVIYGYLEFDSDRTETVALKLGSDDGLKAWFNGKLLLTNNTVRSLSPNDDLVRIQIKTGTNRLLMKIVQQKGLWGFAAQLSSLADETREWRKTVFKGYQICLNQYLPKPGPLNLLVSTVPASAIREQVELTVSNHQDEQLKKLMVWTGTPIKINLPSNFKGVGRITASGTGLKSGQKAETIILVGDGKRIIKEGVELARRTVAKTSYRERGEDVAATLTFLADQLEGKLHSTLTDTKRNLRALQIIYELVPAAQNHSRVIGSKTGVRQWAYRSPIDGSCQPYTVYLPDSYTAKRRYALLVNLHGYSGDDYNTVNRLVQDYQPDDFIIVAPFGRGDLAYASAGEQDVLDVIALLERTYSIDPDRIYLMGSSMGGCGAWRIGQFYADRFALLAPFCGWTDMKYLTNLRNLPVFVVHGADDPTVSVSASQRAVAGLSDLDYRVRYDELPNVGHGALDGWMVRNGVPQFFEYLRGFRREPWPERVSLAIPYLRFGKHYWVRVEDSANPGEPCQLSARVIDERHLLIDTINVTAFSLNLRHPKLARTGRIVVNINGSYVTVNAGEEDVLLTFSDNRGRFVSSTRPSKALAQREGGGLADLFTKPLYIVYGTKSRTKLLRKAAERLADWTITEDYPSGSKVGRFRVIADRDVTNTILKSSNLLCIGTVSENMLTAKFSKKLPVGFSKDSVEISGQRYTKTGFTLVCYNPYEPSRLAGIISFPFKDQDLMEFVTGLNLNLRSYALDYGVGTFTTPDLLLFNANTQVTWKGSLNLFWKELRAL